MGKLRYMHIAVPGAVSHLLHTQRALNQDVVDRAWLLPDFHRVIVDWRALALQAASRPTHLAKIVHCEPTRLGLSGASVLGKGGRGSWIDPDQMGHNLAWRHPSPPETIVDLVLSTNIQETITKSDLELDVLVLPEATLLEAVSEACTATPRSRSINTPTVSWSMREALSINPVVADLLHICALHSIFFLNPSVFYHPGQKTCMADDGYRLFNLTDTSFLTHMYVVCPHSQGSWKTPPP